MRVQSQSSFPRLIHAGPSWRTVPWQQGRSLAILAALVSHRVEYPSSSSSWAGITTKAPRGARTRSATVLRAAHLPEIETGGRASAAACPQPVATRIISRMPCLPRVHGTRAGVRYPAGTHPAGTRVGQPGLTPATAWNCGGGTSASARAVWDATASGDRRVPRPVEPPRNGARYVSGAAPYSADRTGRGADGAGCSIFDASRCTRAKQDTSPDASGQNCRELPSTPPA